MAAGQIGVSRFAIAQAQPRVVIIGGGAGGATVATLLKRTAPNIDVTLVERNVRTVTSTFANLVLAGLRSFDSLTHTYGGLEKQGIRVLADVAIDVDTARKGVTLISGGRIVYDRLVLSPGVDMRYDAIAGYSRAVAQAIPHAWRGGEQTTLLKAQIEAMADGGVVLLAAPPNPYCCPPAPYERACLIAHYLRTHKPRSKVILLDAKRSFSKQSAFMEAIHRYYPGLVEMHLSSEAGDFTVAAVDPWSRTLTTKGGQKLQGTVLNIVPAQRAGAIAVRAGCVEGDWCPVSAETFLSTKVQDVHVIGDAAVASDMPKSAFAANSQGRLVASYLAHSLGGGAVEAPGLRNISWSLVAPDDCIKVGANYIVAGKALVPLDAFVSQAGESDPQRRANVVEAREWYSALVQDMFGGTT